MGKIKKRKRKSKVETFEVKGHAFADHHLGHFSADDIFPLPEEEVDHVMEGYSIYKDDHCEHFNDDLGIDQNDYEVEQEKYNVQSKDIQPIAVDRYFERLGKSRRTPR